MTTMMEYELGITAVPPLKWKKRGEPSWKETTKVTSADTFHKIAKTVCETTVKQQRQPGGLTYRVDDQHWDFTITSYADATTERGMFEKGGEPVHRLQIVPTGSEDMWAYENEYSNRFAAVLPCDTKIGQVPLTQGQVLLFDYDQTERFLKVLSVRRRRGSKK